MRARGLIYKEVLLSLAVLLIAGAGVFFVARAMQGKKKLDSDVDSMRTIYVSLALYEGDQNGQMAPDLLAARDWMPDELIYQSNSDPFVGGNGPFPLDPGLPSSRLESPVRISYSFIYAFATSGKAKVKPWSELKFDPLVGFLANEWQGDVKPLSDFQATVAGKVLRLNTDGALHEYTAPSRVLGDPQVLFFSKG